ncbi:unnamed protein product [Cyclocybe aegerita]|uniref:3-deoxy-7-phosphoheptulonate synthase n=1 Tax=Cyclocybe aegerita TaxID=1973307 RepID=A0A8S0X652_CYCAE|nr:unnamed protein product [Cyclocybe aegerita]
MQQSGAWPVEDGLSTSTFAIILGIRTESASVHMKMQINKGLHIAHTRLLDVAKLGLPAGCEFLDTISPQYTTNLVSWGAIGARTTELQVHHKLTSALSMPTSFKNSMDGSIGIAIDACCAARSGHVFLSMGKEGLRSIIETTGNLDVHVILCGGASGLNYAAEFVHETCQKLVKAGLPQKIMIDCSHGNSSKQHHKQADNIAHQLESEDTSSFIMGVMIESNLVEGCQDIPASGPAGLKRQFLYLTASLKVSGHGDSWLSPMLEASRSSIRCTNFAQM